MGIFEDEMQRQLAPYYSARFISDWQLSAYGLIDPEVAVEESITVNTIKMADDKWLCPLSGKKFKGPEYVRKHIETKHPEAIDEAKAETLYFNNYLRDFAKPVDVIDNSNEHKNIDPTDGLSIHIKGVAWHHQLNLPKRSSSTAMLLSVAHLCPTRILMLSRIPKYPTSSKYQFARFLNCYQLCFAILQFC